jgi:cysteine-rich repeat protein
MSHAPQIRLGTFACLLLTCAVAPPLVRGAGSGTINDGGGCNGSREVQFVADSEAGTSTTEGSSTGATTGEPTTMGEGVCGDGMLDVGEGCDDGNDVEEDGCPSGGLGQCKAEGRCGDGFVWSGKEECDDGNGADGDGCEGSCVLTASVCGDGVKDVGEGCDDGNDVEEDGCPSGGAGQCKGEARCGDGFVWAGMEGCDDGNEEEEDGCPSGGVGQCKGAARCGDGFVWSGMEGCDDGNDVEEDGCPSGGLGQCEAEASCGDGFVWAGMEDCDDGNVEDLDGCNHVCAPPRYVFITSGNGPNNNGNLGGVAGADAYCQGLAEAAKLPGTYRAWLTGADAGSAPAQRFGSAGFAGWYVLPTKPPTGVARGWADLTGANEDVPANYLQSAIIADEKGVIVDDANVWTNTKTDGVQQASDKHCSDWSTSDGDLSGLVGRGKAGVLGASWTNNKEDDCAGGARLYCFQTE